MKSTFKQDPTQHFQSRPNTRMGGPMQTPGPSGPIMDPRQLPPKGGGMGGDLQPGGGFVSHMPTVGQGGVGQPGGMIPPGGYPRNGGTPGGVPKQPRGGYDGSGINPGGGIMNPRPTPGMNSGGGIMNPRPVKGGGMSGGFQPIGGGPNMHPLGSAPKQIKPLPMPTLPTPGKLQPGMGQLKPMPMGQPLGSGLAKTRKK
jgi:hypothetical protein